MKFDALYSVMVLCFLFQSCVISHLKYGENDKESIGKNGKTPFEDYSSLGGQYLPLKGVLLKSDNGVEFIGTQKDSLLDTLITWHKYRFKVVMRLVEKWSYKGETAKTPRSQTIEFELQVIDENVNDIYISKVNEYLDRIDKIFDPFKFKNNDLYCSYQCNYGQVILKLPSDPNKNNELFLFSSNKVIKLKTNNDQAIRVPYLSSFVIYNLTTGIAFIKNEKVCQIDEQHLEFYN